EDLDKNKNLNLTSYHKEVSNNESLFKETQKNNKFNKIDAFLKENKIEEFGCANFEHHQKVDEGGSSIIYSAKFQGQKYALKSLDLNFNIEWDNKKVKGFLNE
ncbi:7106_t:CDS:1, partial [Gigaspora rosea]